MIYDLTQDFLYDPLSDIPRSIPVHSFAREAGDAAKALADINDALGIAISLSAKGHVRMLSLATPDRIYLLSIEPRGANAPPRYRCLDNILGGTYVALAGFDMAKLALHIFNDLQCHTRGVDLSTLFSPSSRNPWDPSEFVTKRMDSRANSRKIDRIWDDDKEERSGDHVCLRAWLSACAARSSVPQLHGPLKVDTRLLDSAELACLGQLVTQMDILEKAKPKLVENEFSHVDRNVLGELLLHNTRYSNHVRKSGKRSHVVLTDQNGKEVTGHATHVDGRQTVIKAHHASSRSNFQRICVVGREDLTSSERARNEFILLILRGERMLKTSLFIRYLWFPSDAPLRQSPVKNVPYHIIQEMNESQSRVIVAMVSRETNLIITHGPPGTGKTRTIAAGAQIWDKRCSPVWIAAQSNVAVKNIAKSLVQCGVEFKLLVSKEFYVEWHEHLYETIQKSIVRSDELPKDKVGMDRLLLGVNVMLCTLSMLSNPQLEQAGVFKLVPVERLVIDEASQIDVFEYMHLFDKFADLNKVCFFGDPKQLPPYGQDSAPELQSIFNVKKLRGLDFTYFLNTQYRMPVPLGTFISQEVYDSKLRSEHAISAMSSVVFVDVTKGVETKDKHSWKNMGEVQTIVHLVRHYYQHTDFCVITPYDAQRATIEKQLKDEDLPWQRVFNVDSFQGNEARYVLVSVTRTERPGFLQSQNRVNVMLTRCKSGMVIVTNRAFLRNAAQHTLLGKLAQYWERNHGQARTWIDWKLVVEKNAHMPGAPGHCPPPSKPILPTPGRALPVSNPTPVGRYVSPRHNRIDEEPLENAFESLNITGTAKPRAYSPWDNLSGLAGVKQVAGVSRYDKQSWRAQGGSTSRVGQPLANPDPFPSLNKLQALWNLKHALHGSI